MIVVEKVLEDIFNLIPERSFTDLSNKVIVVPEPTYHFGDAKECNALIKLKKGGTYPLIFQTSITENQIPKAEEVSTDIELVLCTRNLKQEMLNTSRWETSYKNILMPLVDNVYQALNESKKVRFDNTFTLEKRPNYSETEAKTANAFIDIVDAVIFRASITIMGKPCLNKNIKFNN